jgi:BlaI family penicillinase repressor
MSNVTDAELAVLLTLWEHGPAPIRQLVDALYPGGKAAQYATVQKLLERLEAKECVRRDRAFWPHVYHAVVDRATFIGWHLRETAEKLCGGSMAPLLMHLLKAEQFSSEESRELRAFFEQLKRTNPSNDPSA